MADNKFFNYYPKNKLNFLDSANNNQIIMIMILQLIKLFHIFLKK